MEFAAYTLYWTLQIITVQVFLNLFINFEGVSWGGVSESCIFDQLCRSVYVTILIFGFSSTWIC